MVKMDKGKNTCQNFFNWAVKKKVVLYNSADLLLQYEQQREGEQQTSYITDKFVSNLFSSYKCLNKIIMFFCQENSGYKDNDTHNEHKHWNIGLWFQHFCVMFFPHDTIYIFCEMHQLSCSKTLTKMYYLYWLCFCCCLDLWLLFICFSCFFYVPIHFWCEPIVYCTFSWLIKWLLYIVKFQDLIKWIGCS